MHRHPQQRQQAGDVLVGDLEAEARGGAAGDHLGGKFPAIVQQRPLRHAIAVDHVAKRQLHGVAVRGQIEPPGQHLAGIHIREEHALRPDRQRLARPAHEDVKLVVIALDALQRHHGGLVAGLMRKGPAQGIGALAAEDLGGCGDSGLVPAPHLMDRRHRQAIRFGDLHRAVITSGKGRAAEPQKVAFDQRAELGRRGGGGPRHLEPAPVHQIGQPVGLLDPLDTVEPVPDRLFRRAELLCRRRHRLRPGQTGAGQLIHRRDHLLAVAGLVRRSAAPHDAPRHSSQGTAPRGSASRPGRWAARRAGKPPPPAPAKPRPRGRSAAGQRKPPSCRPPLLLLGGGWPLDALWPFKIGRPGLRKEGQGSFICVRPRVTALLEIPEEVSLA